MPTSSVKYVEVASLGIQKTIVQRNPRSSFILHSHHLLLTFENISITANPSEVSIVFPPRFQSLLFFFHLQLCKQKQNLLSKKTNNLTQSSRTPTIVPFMGLHLRSVHYQFPISGRHHLTTPSLDLCYIHNAWRLCVSSIQLHLQTCLGFLTWAFSNSLQINTCLFY